MSSSPKKSGRPIELTPAIVAEARQLSACVEYLETLAPLLGMGKTTLYAWLNRGSREQRRRDRGQEPRESESIFVDFWNAIKKGNAEAEKRSLDTIRAAADAGVWQAAAWRLERAHPERWGVQRGEIARLTKMTRKLAEAMGVDPDTGERK